MYVFSTVHVILMLASTQIILKKQIMLSLFASSFNADLLRQLRFQSFLGTGTYREIHKLTHYIHY
jgi:hypothetical protein